MERNYTVYLGSDHRGFEFKEKIIQFLEDQDIPFLDLGPWKADTEDDYDDFAIRVASKVQENPNDRGILICGTGVGMYIIANKFNSVRAGNCRTGEEAEDDRKHHDSNILVLDQGTLGQGEVYKEVVSKWLETPFEKGGRHERRIKKVKLYEAEYIKSFMYPSIVPAILSEEIDEYTAKAKEFSKFSKRVHVDIMDGKYVFSKSPDVLAVLEELADLNIYQAVHLMVNKPGEYFEYLKSFDFVYLVYAHVEVLDEQYFWEELPFDVGLVINPDTDVNKFREKLLMAKIILVMTVNPGKQGGQFVPEGLDTIAVLRDWGYKGEIHVDGHINTETVKKVMEYEPDVLNVGSYIMQSEKPRAHYKELGKIVRVWLKHRGMTIRIGKEEY